MPTYEWYELSPFARFFFTRVLPVLFLILGGYTLYFVVTSFLQGEASHDWPVVTGKVTHSELIEYDDDDTLKIEYSYRIEGEAYHNDRIFFGAILGTLFNSSAQQRIELAQQFPEGSSPKVYYDRSDPQQSVLVPGVRGKLLLRCLGAFGGVFVLAGCFFFVFLPGHASRSIAVHYRIGRSNSD